MVSQAPKTAPLQKAVPDTVSCTQLGNPAPHSGQLALQGSAHVPLLSRTLPAGHGSAHVPPTQRPLQH